MASRLKDARVLVAEDNLIIALDLVTELEEAGACVLGPAARVRDALALVKAMPPDGAILDVDLLDGPVTPLAEQLLEQHVPVVFCTGVGVPQTLDGRQDGVAVYSKPCEPHHLTERLTELMKNSEDRSTGS